MTALKGRTYDRTVLLDEMSEEQGACLAGRSTYDRATSDCPGCAARLRRGAVRSRARSPFVVKAAIGCRQLSHRSVPASPAFPSPRRYRRAGSAAVADPREQTYENRLTGSGAGFISEWWPHQIGTLAAIQHRYPPAGLRRNSHHGTKSITCATASAQCSRQSLQTQTAGELQPIVKSISNRTPSKIARNLLVLQSRCPSIRRA